MAAETAGALRRAALAAVLVLLAPAAAAQPTQPPPADLLAACAGCHGANGNAQVEQFPSIAGQPRIFIENQLVLIREGLREVPAMQSVMKGMDDATIGALATHFAALPATSRAPGNPDARRIARGEAISQQRRCGTCHLADYAGQQQVPRLSGQSEAYLTQSLREFRDRPGPGRDTIMASTLLGLSDQELADLAHYLATRKP